MASCLGVGTRHPHLVEANVKNPKTTSTSINLSFSNNRHRTFQLLLNSRNRCRGPTRIYYNSDDKQLPPLPPQQQPTGIQLYSDIERWVGYASFFSFCSSKLTINLVFLLLCMYICRLLTETVRQSQAGWSGFGDWSEVEVCFAEILFSVIWTIQLGTPSPSVVITNFMHLYLRGRAKVYYVSLLLHH